MTVFVIHENYDLKGVKVLAKSKVVTYEKEGNNDVVLVMEIEKSIACG